MTSYPPDDDNPFDSAPVSADAITPRGGFMARPGLKVPPRHAVVVRGGDAPQSEHIPVLRSSVPPPPPASQPAEPSADEKITLRAIPTPPAPHVEVALASSVPVVSDSLPPPSYAPSSRAPLSDAPFVAGPLEGSDAPPSQRPAGSRWTIVAAAAAGLILGLASVVAKVGAPSVAAQPPAGAPLTPAAAPPEPAVATPLVPSSRAPADRASAAPAPSSERAGQKPARAPAASVKRSIF